MQDSGTELWATWELGTADLGDGRLTQRLIRLTATLAEHPEQSLPQAHGTWAGTKAAYRFFDNPRVRPEAILAAHRQATLRRIAGESWVLVVQDTTQFDFTRHRATRGLGPTGAAGLQGFFLHSALAVSPDGIPLGLLGWHTWRRRPQDARRPRPPEERESRRWRAMLRASSAGLPPGTRAVTVADREADGIDFLQTALAEGQHVLLRAHHDRLLADRDARLREAAASAPVVGTFALRVPRQHQRPERTAHVELRVTRVELAPPRGREHLPPIPVTVLLVRETDPPQDEPGIAWLLLTTLPVATTEDALRCVQWYTYRWRIERFHYTLKSGCQIEQLQLETGIRLRRALAVYCVVAWRLLYLTYVARVRPELPCSTILTDDEWRALACRMLRTAEPPPEPPDVRTAVRWIAQLGGFLGRKGDGEPGVKVLWRGFRRLQDIAEDWRILRSLR